MGMKQHFVRGLALFACLGAISAAASARVQSLEPAWLGFRHYGAAAAETPTIEPLKMRRELYAQWNAMPPEQRQQMRQQMREHWQQMPPEQREARRQERERWQQMPPEERQRMREELRERREDRGPRGGGRRDFR